MIFIAWLLVSINGYGVISYSPPLHDLQTCQFLQEEQDKMHTVSTKCIQVKVAK